MRTIPTILAAAAIAFVPFVLPIPVVNADPSSQCPMILNSINSAVAAGMDPIALRGDYARLCTGTQIAQNTPTPPPEPDPWGHEYGPGDRHGPAGPYAPNVPIVPPVG
jgi:hypothetical protein